MDFLKYSVIILFVILTVFTIKFQPEMHLPLIIEDADFKLTRISDGLVNQKVSKKQTPHQTLPPESIDIPATETKNIEINVQEETNHQTKYIPTAPDPTPKSSKQEPAKEEMTQLELLQEILKNAEKVSEQNTPTEHPKSEQTVTKSTHKNPYMTEQEEIIAWNKWRSSIQNEIMKNSDIEYAPLGTIFMFTFIVDKFGNISNIKVQCSNPNFMDVARNDIKPAISGLQRKPILNFPRGTQRTSTVVNGTIIIGTFNRYSTPDDYSDYERVVY